MLEPKLALTIKDAIAKAITNLTREDMEKDYPKAINLNFEKLMNDYNESYNQAVDEISNNLSDNFNCEEINKILANIGISELKVYEMDDFDEETSDWDHLELVKNTQRNDFDADKDYFAIDGDNIVSDNYVENLVSYYDDDIKASEEVSDKAHEQAMENIENNFEDYIKVVEDEKEGE